MDRKEKRLLLDTLRVLQGVCRRSRGAVLHSLAMEHAARELEPRLHARYKEWLYGHGADQEVRGLEQAVQRIDELITKLGSEDALRNVPSSYRLDD